MATISRRGVARGTAWAVPAITVAAASPAVAASAPPSLDISGMAGLSYYESNPGGTGTHSLDASFGSVVVKNLPASVTVTNVTATIYVQNRTQRSPWPDRGYPSPATSWVSHNTTSAATYGTGTSTWWDAKNHWVQPYTYNGISTFNDGRNTYSAWSMTSNWTPGIAGDPRTPTYNGGTFTMPELGSFFLTAVDANAPAPAANTVVAMSGITVIVTLSNGQTLSYTGATNYVN